MRLTHRERQLVQGILNGRTNRELATELGLSEQTVKNHLTVLFQKAGVRSRLELAVLAMRQQFDEESGS